MAIVHLGAKRLQGIKLDRVVDSLGSSADGTNSGITLNKPLGSVTHGGSDITSLTWTQTIGSSTSDTFYVLKDTSNDLMDIKAAGNCGTESSPSIAYATLPSTLSTDMWVMRFKLVFNTVTAESSGGKSFFTNFFIVDSGTSSSSVGSENGFGFKFIADAGSTQTQFYSTTNGTDSGTSMSWTPASGNTIYVEISYSSGTATANFYSDSGYSSRVGSTTANATRSGTFSGLKFPQIALRQDTGGNGVMEIDMSELKIYDGVNGGDAKLGTGAYSFDGTNDFITAGSTTDFTFLHDGGKNTVTFWLKKDTPESGDVRVVFSTADGTSNGMEVVYLDRSSSSETRKVKIEFTNSSGQQIGFYYAQEFFPNDSDWHHYAIVTDISNSYLKAYVDGVEKTADSSYPSFTGTPVSTAQQHVLNIGRRGSGTFYLDGALDDLSFWDRNLSTTEIEKLANNNQVGSLTSNVASYIFSDQANSRLKFVVKRGQGSGHSGWIDTGLTSSSSNWAIKFKLNVPTRSVASNNTGYFAFSSSTVNQDSDYSGKTGNAIGMYINLRSSGETAAHGALAVQAGNTYSYNLINDENSLKFSDGSTAYTKWFKIVKNGNTVNMTIHDSESDADSNTLSSGSDTSTGTNATAGAFTNLRYLKWYNVAGGSTDEATIYFSDLKLYDNTTATTGTPTKNYPFVDGDAQSVSTISNKAGLKAHYTMNSTSLGATAFFTPDDDYASASGWTDVDTGGDIAIDTTNKGVTYTDVNVGDSGIGKSLGKTLSNSKWLVQFTFQIADWNTNDAGLVSLTSDHTQGFKVSGLKTINFMPQGTPLGGNSPSPSYNRFVLMSGQTNSYAEKASPNDKFVANTQYWVDMYRDGSNIKCKVWTNSGRTGTPHWESDNLAIGTNLDGLTGIQHWNENAADIDIGTGWVREVKVYDGVTATDGCKNDASSTSDLEAMTNLPTNTIFEQTDDTPKYYWKQSDNTWLIDAHSAEAIRHIATGDGLFCGGAGSLTNNTSLATNYVWATNSANLPNNLGYSAGGGYKSSFMACGGYIASGSFFDSSTIWDGSAWASAVALDTQRRDTTAYGGNTSSAIIALGRNNSGTEIDSSSKWNGTSWSSAGAIGSNRVGEHVGGDGGDVTMLISGGSSTYRDNFTDKWNGTTWSAVANIPSNMTSHNHAGRSSESAHIATGNSAWAGDWDGTSWTSVTAISGHSTSTPRYTSGGGTKDSHWIMCGLDGGTSLNNCSLWNGSSWSAKGNMTETQYGGLGDGTIR